MSDDSYASLQPPLQLRPSAWRPVDAWLALVLPLFIPAIMYMSLILWLPLIGRRQLLDTLMGESVLAVGLSYIVSIVVELGVIALLMRMRHVRVRDLGLRATKLRWFGIAVLLYVAQLTLIGLVFSLIETFLPSINTNEAQSVFEFGKQGIGWWVSFTSAVIIAPILEEVTFRGIVFAGFASRWSPVAAACISSLAFALLHGQVNVGIYTFILGLMLCWLYRRSNSLWPGILLHFANNLIAFWLLTGSN